MGNLQKITIKETKHSFIVDKDQKLVENDFCLNKQTNMIVQYKRTVYSGSMGGYIQEYVSGVKTLVGRDVPLVKLVASNKPKYKLPHPESIKFRS